MTRLADAHSIPDTLPRDLERLRPGGEIDWQVGAGETLTGARDYSRTGYYGNAPGYWVLRGNGTQRKLTQGEPPKIRSIDFGEPIDNIWRYEGHPGTGYDQHILIVEADGTVWQGIAWNENAHHITIIKNVWQIGNANFWYADHFGPDELIRDFRSGTAGGLNLPAYTWLIDERPGCVGLQVSDYQGADGLLSAGPHILDKLVLPENSWSYDYLMDGPPAAQRFARNLATYGARVADRNGYADIEGPQVRIGNQPKEAVFWIQSGGQWDGKDTSYITVKLDDFRYGIPDDSPPVDPRAGVVEAAGREFSLTLEQVGLTGPDTAYVVGLNDRTVSETIRLINEQGAQR